MKPEHSQVQILDPLEIDVTPEDLAASIKTSIKRPEIQEKASKALAKVRNIWHPRAVVRWLDVKNVTNTGVLLRLQENETTHWRLGYSGNCLEAAEQALVGVYTAGKELEQEKR